MLNPLRQKISQVSTDGTYDIEDVLNNKGITPIIPPLSNVGYYENDILKMKR
ncbi:hypothetical protein [Candidatus Enterovibrio escicola]|uniref:hypothetical protein n=1 Tax=Candidatus Enterovibrio escicola TaxID=1927127 RepID=UPI0016804682|nr:hypothetical protein [Candidatus Enterovibrio escacola]